ncbi:MAG: hypothetical protein JSU68_08015 [Phycisphaerales bacterium]|nr:MAG: hypothetical protein JSU68_08015 [Phycisphaerales bacterium]
MTKQLALVLAFALMGSVMMSGCMDAAHNPLAAASGAVKLSQVAGETVGLAELANIIANELTAEELASLVNMGLGEDWSLEDASSVQDLLGEMVLNADALADCGIDDPGATNEEIQAALVDAGIEATDEQIDLLRDLFSAVEGAV